MRRSAEYPGPRPKFTDPARMRYAEPPLACKLARAENGEKVMSILLGAIGDDLTGSADLALMLGKHGLPALQLIGVPESQIGLGNARAAVVALKSRTAPAAEAVAQSLAACDWLLRQGARQIFFKYCSTFDSTESGNIGPVTEALLEHLQVPATILCPAFPGNGRTVYQGHLFVDGRLLSESGMRHHPLTPMTDADLVRFLSKQIRSPDSVGCIPFPVVDQGPAAIAEEQARQQALGRRYLIVDALTDRHLKDIGTAGETLRLLTGGSGLAMGLPANFRRAGRLPDQPGLVPLPGMQGPAAVLAGSCSAATRSQVKRMAQHHPALRIDPLTLAAGLQPTDDVIHWFRSAVEQGPVLIYSSAGPEEVRAAQEHLGKERAGALVERFLAETARALVAEGVTKLIVAGGETAGAVVEALGVKTLHIGPEIAPGVPWTFSSDSPELCLALKSGNFGDQDFFEKALGMLP